MNSDDIKICNALKSFYNADVCYGKGGFFVKGHGFITRITARKLTGIHATPRIIHERISAYGDYATIAQINGIRI